MDGEDTTELPDISELVEVIRNLVTSMDAMLEAEAAEPAERAAAAAIGQGALDRFRAEYEKQHDRRCSEIASAIDAQRDLLARIDSQLSSEFST